MQEILQKKKKELEQIFEKEEAVLAYLFGSQVRGTAGPQSDVDMAILFSKENQDACFQRRTSLALKIEEQTGLRNVEIICLRESPPLLKHRAILSGHLLYAANSQARRLLELQALQEYEDFKYHLAVSNKAMRTHISQNTFGKALLPSYNPHKF